MAYATENKGLHSMGNYLHFHTAQHPRILQLSEHTLIRTNLHCIHHVIAELNGTEYSKKKYFTPHSKHIKFVTSMQNYLALYYNSVLHTAKT